MAFRTLLTMLAAIAGSVGAFPDGSCFLRSCTQSPYMLAWNNDTCFRIVDKVCVPDPRTGIDCCNTFRSALVKIVISAKPECESTIRAVSVNGIKKAGGVFFDTTPSPQLRITSLTLNATTAVNAVLCFSAVAPCNTAALLCDTWPCLFAVYDPFRHACCPSCEFFAPSPQPAPSPSPSPSPSPLPWF